MIISRKLLSPSDVEITTMDTPDGYRDYLNRDSGIEYRIAITDDEEDQWDSIATDPMVYPLESVSMCYEH